MYGYEALLFPLKDKEKMKGVGKYSLSNTGRSKKIEESRCKNSKRCEESLERFMGGSLLKNCHIEVTSDER